MPFQIETLADSRAERANHEETHTLIHIPDFAGFPVYRAGG